MRRGGQGESKYEPLESDGHESSSTRAIDHPAFSILEEATVVLEEGGVRIDVIHPEAAIGQYEIVQSKLPAIEAVDTLVYTREVPSAIAAEKGYRATLHPKPFKNLCGTGAHIHMSFSSREKQPAVAVYESFYAGVLSHLRAVCAFTYSGEASYERAVDGCWSGGTWISWGTQNREAPSRKIEGSHWEIRCVDGLANPYLAVAAILCAGVLGVKGQEQLRWADLCDLSAAHMNEEQRRAYGIEERLPTKLEEALQALKEDGELGRMLEPTLVQRYCSVKREEMKILEGMGEEKKRVWLMARY